MFPYLGGKSRIRDRIVDQFRHLYDDRQYREPFCGAFHVGREAMLGTKMTRFWVNDIDVGVYFIWKAVRDVPDALKAAIQSYSPQVAHHRELVRFFRTKGLCPPADSDIVPIAAFMLIHQKTTFCALGSNNHDALDSYALSLRAMESRWRPDKLCERIQYWHEVFTLFDVEITNLHRHEVLNREGRAFLYLDPPYRAAQCSQLKRHLASASKPTRAAA